MTLRQTMTFAVVTALFAAPAAATQAANPAPKSSTGGQTAKPAPKSATPAGKSAAPAAKGAASKAALKDPASLKAVAPALYEATFSTTAGDFVVEVHRDWAPKEADRFYNLVKNGYYDECRFFRVMPNFMVQFGINGDPAIQKNWMEANITDDPVTQSNKRGYLSFAQRPVPNTRTTQVFINFRDNTGLDSQGQGFAPFGQVTSGMDVVDKINSKHGQEPDQGRIQTEGNKYLNAAYPDLDYIKKATITKGAAPAAPTKGAPKKAATPTKKK